MRKRAGSKFSFPGVGMLGFFAIVGAAAMVYFYLNPLAANKDPVVATEKEVAMLVKEVGKLIMLPEGETPTTATVSNPEQLSGQAFFANAQAGYKVLIYVKAKKAILYDPVRHKIVEVAPLSIDGQ